MRFTEWTGSSGGLVYQLQKLQVNIHKSSDFLLKLTKLYALNEASYHVSYDAESYLIPSVEFQQYLGGFGTQILRNGPTYNKSCGKDGCAYFCSGRKVIKFSADANEFRIANAVKGNLKIVPIVDAVEWDIEAEESVLYSILMNELSTDFYTVTASIHEAANIVSGVANQLQVLVSKKPEISMEYIRKRLSVGYMIREMSSVRPEVVDAIRDLVRVLRLIYDKSGVLVGSDWENGRNYGVTKKMRVQPFDFGRGDLHKKAADQIDLPPTNYKVVPKAN